MSKFKRELRNTKVPRRAPSRLDEDEALVGRLADLLDDGVLSDWEVGFAEDMGQRTGVRRSCLTESQRDKVEEILGDKE